MWSDVEELRQHEVLPGRISNSSGSELTITASPLDSPRPTVSQKWRTLTEPQFTFVSVTQSLHNTEVVKEVRGPRYLWERARRLSRSTWLLWCAALAALLLLIVLLALTLRRVQRPQDPADPGEPDVPGEDADVAPHQWNITRAMWGATPENVTIFPWDEHLKPLRLVIVQHTTDVECHNFNFCSYAVQQLQRFFLEDLGYDLGYHFMVGNDGRVYQGRGWNTQAAHTLGYNRCALGLGFTGDYRPSMLNTQPTAQQLNRTHMLLQGGVRDGMLHPDYIVLAATDVRNTTSPGENLYEALRDLPHFLADSQAQHFRSRTCEDIYAELEPLDNKSLIAATATTFAPPS